MFSGITLLRRTVLLFAFIHVGVFGNPLRLNSGGPNVQSIGWWNDASLGSQNTKSYIGSAKVKVTGTWAQIYQSHRFAPWGNLVYKIPVNPGSYPVFLMWSETWMGSGLGKRVFTVKVNGKLVNAGKVTNGIVDVYKFAGGSLKPFFLNLGNIQHQNGFINIELGRIPGKNNPFVSGIVLNKNGANAKITNTVTKPKLPNTGTPVNPVSPGSPTCKDPSVTGKLGTDMFIMNVGGKALPLILWGADNEQYISEENNGFKLSSNTKILATGTWAPVYQSFRYTTGGSITYNIPVPPGSFQVNLMHSETVQKSVGARVFDVAINGAIKATNVDIFKKVGFAKIVYTSYPDVNPVNGFISISMIRKKGNPFLSGIFIKGPGASSKAVGGGGDCSAPKVPSISTAPDPIKAPVTPPGISPPETDFKGAHFAHSVSGGPYVQTDFSKNGFADVKLDGTNSHSHKQEGAQTGKIVTFKWTWTDPKNPKAAANGIVTATSGITTESFPLGVTQVSLLVVDQFGYSALETTTVTVNSATVPGAYCYYYNLGDKNPTTVALPLDVKKEPKPLKGGTVGDINFPNTASFGVPFPQNAFYTRCTYYVEVPKAGTYQYKVTHTGPIKLFYQNSLVVSSDSKKWHQNTFTAPKNYEAGLHAWQIHYLRPKGIQGKLSLQFANGGVVPANSVRHDAGSTLPVITGLGKTSTSPAGGELIGIFGSAFVNGVMVKFGGVKAETVEADAGTIQVKAPPGQGVKFITVTTKAGTSNGVPFTYTSSDVPVKFTTQFVQNAGGGKFYIPQIACATYGPDQRLYLGAVNSQVYALTLDINMKVKKKCQKGVMQQYPRAVLGVAFNPKSNALKLYMTTSTIFWKDRKQFKTFAEGWTNGKVQSITMAGKDACFNDDLKDVVTGLPVSNHDHAVNALTFLPNGNMLISVGGFTNGGISVPFDNLGGVPSNPLAGAIVVCPGGGGNIKYSNIWTPLKSKVIGGGCKVWASGLRNSFSMQLHTNGNLYATDNGPNMNFGKFSTNCFGGQKASKNVPDKLFKVQPGKWHGHPSINRNQCVFEGPGAVKPLKNDLQSSTNGVLEYRSNTFGGKIKGNLFLAKFAVNGAGKLSRVQLNAQGNIAPNGFTNLFLGKSGLAIVEGPRGEMVQPRVYQSSILVAKPVYPYPSDTTVIGVLPNRGSAGGGATIQISGHNFGNNPTVKVGGKPCSNVVVINAGTLTCVTPNGSGKVGISLTGSKGTWTSSGTDYWYF